MMLDKQLSNSIISPSSSSVKLSTASCCLSIFGAFMIFGTYIYIPEIRNTTRKLLLCLTVADFLTAAGYLTSSIAYYHNKEESVCEVQSFITTLSSLVSFFLTVAIEIHICVSVITGGNRSASKRFFFGANIVCWLVPASIVCTAQAKGKLGATNSIIYVGTGPWCWIKDDPDDPQDARFWRFLAGKGWEFQCYLFTISMYILLKFYIYLKHRNKSLNDINNDLRENDRYFLYVWFVLYILRVWGSVRFIISDLGKDKTGTGMKVSDFLINLQAIGDPAQSFGNFILVCVLDGTVRSKFKELFCSVSHVASRSLSYPKIETPRNNLQKQGNSDEPDQSTSPTDRINVSTNTSFGYGSMDETVTTSNDFRRIHDSDDSDKDDTSSAGSRGEKTSVEKSSL